MLPNYCVIDGFLDAQGLQELRAYARRNRAAFEPSEVLNDGTSRYDAATRHSLRRSVADGELPLFRSAVARIVARLFTDLAIPPEPLGEHEIEMVAHGDGALFTRHLDTFIRGNRETGRGDRLISIVFYFTLGPRRFRGGELALFPFVPGKEPAVIEPVGNRLVAFPSFAMHEVRRVTVEEDTFENARFAVNCWLPRPSSAA